MAESFRIQPKRDRQGPCKALSAMQFPALPLLPSLTAFPLCETLLNLVSPRIVGIGSLAALAVVWPPALLLGQAVPAAAVVPGGDHGGPITLANAASAAVLLASLAWTVLQIIRYFRRSPAIEAEFATKAELSAAVRKLEEAGEGRRNEIKQELETLSRGMTTQLMNLEATIGRDNRQQALELQAIQRSLGRLEGRAEAAA